MAHSHAIVVMSQMKTLQLMHKQQRFADLKHQIWSDANAQIAGRLDLDMPALQEATSGGLALGRMHLVSGGPQDAAATGFAVALIRKLLQQNPDQAVVWCLPAMPRAGQLFGAGLAAMGIDPARIILVCESHPLRAVAASEEALAAQGVAAVICEYSALAEKSDLWLKAARRLQLAAEQGKTTGFMLGPSAAAAGFETRWHITPTRRYSQTNQTLEGQMPIAEYASDWQPCWQVELMHCRGGRPASLQLCWDIRSGRFRPFESVISKRSAYQDYYDSNSLGSNHSGAAFIKRNSGLAYQLKHTG